MAIGNNFEYMLVDFSYILQRNLFAASKGKEIGEYNEGDVVRITIQTMNKLARDYNINASKIIFLADKWDYTLGDGGYIRHYLLKDIFPYKGSRSWMTEQKLEEMRCSGASEEDIHKAELELYMNKVKSKAKKIMTEEFKYIGMPVLSIPGYEADDLAWISGCMLYGRTGGKKSVFVTKDSDWQSFLNPELVFFKIPTGGSEPVFISYDEKYNEIPEVLRNSGVSLYQYNAYMNSLGYSHNDNGKTIRQGADPTMAILKAINNDFSDIENVEGFKAQVNSFDVSKFPKFEEAKGLVTNHFSTDGRLGDINQFREFCKKYNITGISDKYYTDFISRFDQKLFSE